MKRDKTMVSIGLGIACLVPLMVYAASSVMKKRTKKRKPTTFEIDEDTQWVLDCLDEMILDIKHMQQWQDLQGKRIACMEDRLNTVNARVDGIVNQK